MTQKAMTSSDFVMRCGELKDEMKEEIDREYSSSATPDTRWQLAIARAYEELRCADCGSNPSGRIYTNMSKI